MGTGSPAPRAVRSCGRRVAAHVKIAVLVGSLLAALLAAVVLRLRNRTYRRLDEAEVAAQDSERNSP